MLLHRFPDETPFEQQMRLNQFDYLHASEHAQASLAEQYVGLPFEGVTDKSTRVPATSAISDAIGGTSDMQRGAPNRSKMMWWTVAAPGSEFR